MRAEFLNIIRNNLNLQKAVMAQAVSHWPLTAAAWVRSRVRFCGGKSGNETGVSPSTSVFLCQYLPTNAPYSSSSTSRSYQKDKRAKPGNLPKLRFSSVNIFPPMLHTGLHLHAALTSRTNGPGNLPKSNALSKIGEH